MNRFSNNSNTVVPTMLAALFIAAAPTSALAYTPQWLACSGEVTITPATGAKTKEPVNDFYVYDPDGKALFKYLEPKKQLSLVGTSEESDKELRWSGSLGGSYTTTWQGQFDLRKKSIRITYKGGGETRIWQQSCQPAQPQPEA